MPVMSTVAGSWYSSGTFWSAAAVVVALLVGIATVAVTYLTRFARQRLEYGLRTVTALLTAPEGVREDLQLFHQGASIENPYLAEVVLAGRGRRDISRNAFDNGDPIRLELGTPIVELLQVSATDSASATPVPSVQVDETALLIGPALIGRRQLITLTVLVEDRPSLTCAAPLPNAQVRARPDDLPERMSISTRDLPAVASMIFLAGGITGAAMLKWFTDH
jgi:hypothetical protein